MQNVIGGVVIAAALVGAFFLGAEYVSSTESGTAESIGEQIDEGVNDAARAIEDAAD